MNIFIYIYAQNIYTYKCKGKAIDMGTEDTFGAFSSSSTSKNNISSMENESRRDPLVRRQELEDEVGGDQIMKSFHCKRCRCFLFDSTHLITHVTSAHKISSRKMNSKQTRGNSTCGSYFLNGMIVSEQDNQGGIDLLSDGTINNVLDDNDLQDENENSNQDFERNQNETTTFSGRSTDFIVSQVSLNEGILEGKLMCINYKCRARIGSFNWSGSQCSCGSWVSPAIQITKSKVDERFL